MFTLNWDYMLQSSHPRNVKVLKARVYKMFTIIERASEKLQLF